MALGLATLLLMAMLAPLLTIGKGGAVALAGDEVCDFDCIGRGSVGLRESGDLNDAKLEYFGVLMLSLIHI